MYLSLKDLQQNQDMINLASELGITIRELALFLLGQIAIGYSLETAIDNARIYFS